MADSLGKKERRKSLSVFSPSSSTFFAAPAAHDRSPSDNVHTVKKKNRRNSGFFGSRNASPSRIPSSKARRPGTAESESFVGVSSSQAETPRPQRKSLQKKKVFGSLRSLHSLEDDEKSLGHSKSSSVDEEDSSDTRSGIGSMVLHHGEVQTTGGMWRRKSQYLVLTDSHLVRFKSQSKAADMFQSIPPSFARAAGNRQSVASIHSMQDAQLPASSDSSAGIPLNTIIAVYMLDEGKPSASVEVAFLDERTRKASFIQMQTPDPQELNLWMVGIRSASELIRTAEPLPFDQKSVEHVARVLEYERDYDPESFRMFRVIQMASTKSPTRASSDDLTKLSPMGCYLAIGWHKLHLVPLQKAASRASVVSLTDLEMASSFGLMNLTSLSMEWGDDSLHLAFRLPLRKQFSVFIASVHSMEIAFWIRQQTAFLRPLWTNLPYDFLTPSRLRDGNSFPPIDLDEDYGCLDRTLVAYSASYGIDTSNIRYAIDMHCDDAPCFKLLPPASPKRKRYTALELVAVMRALRYNEAFRSLSFSGVSLDALQGIRDPGPDIDAHLNRAGAKVHIPGQDHLSVLAQEVRALALKSRSLRRLDFSYSLSRIPTTNNETHDPGCGIPEAIFPVCRRELTNVDWVVLDGIQLGDSDLDYLVDAASQRSSHLRALEVGNCGLSVHDVDLLLSTVIAQGKTLESINISGVQGRLNPDVLQQYIGYFEHIKKINLSRISRTSGPESLITPETLFNWELEELSLSQTAINRETVDAIATYLASHRSKHLRVLRLDQCGLNGQDVAMLLHSMAAQESTRNIHLHVNENRIDNGCPFLFKAIAQDKTPSHLSMRMIDFKKEEHFRELVEALRKNRTLKYLDISKASLPYDAGPETCKSLQLMFEENDVLEDLDISGDNAHLDVARFGIGLNLALTGLKKNRSLEVLRIEHQDLGLQGANTLASVLEENTCLREVYCENNDINLQSFTVLVNGLQRNKSLFSLSCMDQDRAVSLGKIRREFELAKRECANAQASTSSSIRRSLHAAMSVGQVSVGNKLSKPNRASSVPINLAESQISNHDVVIVIEALGRKWDAEVARLHRYLVRNYNLAHGMEDPGDDTASDGRPTTAKSLGTMLDSFKFEVPLSEVGSQTEVASRRESVSTLQTESNVAPEVTLETTPEANPETTQSKVSQSEAPDTSHLDIFRCLDTDTERPQTAPFLFPDNSPQILSECPPSNRLAVPVPAIPSVNRTKSSSIRSTRSSSTLSTGGASTRSAYGMASTTLRGFLSGNSSRDRRMEKMKASPLCVSDKPPQLDWTPPTFDFQDFR